MEKAESFLPLVYCMVLVSFSFTTDETVEEIEQRRKKRIPTRVSFHSFMNGKAKRLIPLRRGTTNSIKRKLVIVVVSFQKKN